MLGIKLWYSGFDGWTRCDRCGERVHQVASPGFASFERWCARCLVETGRHR